MSRRRFDRQGWAVKAEFPHCVEVEILGHDPAWANRYELLVYWPLHHCARDRHTNWGRRDLKALREFSQFRFKDEADAERFRRYVPVVMALGPDEARVLAAHVRDGHPHPVDSAAE